MTKGFSRVVVTMAAMLTAACASAPPAVLPTSVVAPPPSADTKAGWILRLENQRVLREPLLPTPLAAEGTAGAVAIRPALEPDLSALLVDSDPNLRRRAALAIGRVKDPAGLTPLTASLRDEAPRVRAMAAFAIGLIGDARGVAPLTAALADPAMEVRARAIEGLGLIADKSAVPAVFQAAAGCGERIAPLEPDADPPSDREDLLICRLALFALVRLQNFDGIAALTIDREGRPVSRWWPAAFALQRINDPRTLPALRILAEVPSTYTAGFALRGLAALKDPAARPAARQLATRRDADVKVRIAAIRVLGQTGDASDADLLARLLGEGPTSSPLALEAIAALGALARPGAFEALLDLFADPSQAVRAAAFAAAARTDAEKFLVILSGLGRDRDWSVRAALAGILATLPVERVTPALIDLATDDDARVQVAGLRALAAAKAPELQPRLLKALEAADYVVRETAASLLGQTKPDGGVALLEAAYARGQSDSAYGARAAAIEALAAYGGEAAIKVVETALADRDWAVRTRAATLLRGLGRPTALPETPAPTRHPLAFFESPALLHPDYSPHALIETRHGTIEVQLDVVEAPLTSRTFVELARSGFFNGILVHRLVPTFVIQAGDPRGDGEGGPGFTIRDELSPTPYVRGTVGMALAWADTGGSQWFITLSPQPHLDAKYAAFGRVVNGWDVLDRVTAWDAVERVRIWDGVELK